MQAARYHLINTIKLRRGFVDKFLLALTSPGSKLGPSIRSLDISSIPTTIPSYQLNEAIPFLADHLPAVKTLSLAGLDWRTLDIPVQTRFVHAFPHLMQLHIIQCRFQTLGQLVEYVASFPDLDYLRLNKSRWDKSSISLQLPQLSLPRLKVLFLFPAEHRILNLLKCRDLELLSLDDVTKEYIPAVRDFLYRVGPALRELRIRFADNIYVKDVFNADVDLSRNTRLLTLTLVVTLLSFDPPGYKVYFLDWIPAFLASVNSKYLEVVTFRLMTVDVTQFDPNWRELDRVFALPAFANLKKINFNIAHPSTCPVRVDVDPYDMIEELELTIFHCMPNTTRKGLIINTTCTVNPEPS